MPGMAKRISQAVLEDALRNAGGIPAGAAQILGCARSTVTRRIEKSEALQKLCAELEDELLDMCESGMFGLAKKKDFRAMRFILETRGKHRGWTKQIDVKFDKPVPIVFTEGQGGMA